MKNVIRSKIPWRLFEVDYTSSNARQIFPYMVIWLTVETSPICYFKESKEHPCPSQKELKHLLPGCFSDKLYVVFLLSYIKWKTQDEKENRWTKYQVMKIPYGRVLLTITAFNNWNIILKIIKAKKPSER